MFWGKKCDPVIYLDLQNFSMGFFKAHKEVKLSCDERETPALN